MDVNWLQLLQTFGLAVAILIAMGTALWRITSWSAREIVIPLRDKAVSRFTLFLDHIETTVSKLDINVDTVTNNLRAQTDALKQLQTINDDVRAGIAKIAAISEQDGGTVKTLVTDAVNQSKVRHDAVMLQLDEIRQLTYKVLEELSNLGQGTNTSRKQPNRNTADK